MSIDYKPVCGIGVLLTEQEVEKLGITFEYEDGDFEQEYINLYPIENKLYSFCQYENMVCGDTNFCLIINNFLNPYKEMVDKVFKFISFLENLGINTNIIEISELLVC